ncbi:MAG: hypothetical protein EP335_11935 [Alphaproteobacteria bacterium]|nr:MAG: hypothetical protein EP335_11935 [Alphaproteobacteria bacterium]
MSDAENKEDYARLMQEYLDLCNRALAANRDRFPYGAIWQAAEQALSGEEMEFAVVDDAPKARMRVCLKDRHLDLQECGCAGEVPVRRISADYIRRLLADPQKVIDNPSLIDWNWMKKSAGA